MPRTDQKEISSTLVPQKEDLDSIAKVPLLYQNGLKTPTEIGDYFSQSYRQGVFFLNACHILGWIDGNCVTQQGKMLITCQENQRQTLIKEAIRNTVIIKALLTEYGDDFLKKPAIAPISSFIENKAGLSRVTARRRAQSVLRWFEYLNQGEEHGHIFKFDSEKIVRPIKINDLAFDTGIIDSCGHPRVVFINCFKYGLSHNLSKIQEAKGNGCHFVLLAPTSDYLQFDLSVSTEFSEMREKLHYYEVKGAKKEASLLADSFIVSDKHIMDLSRKFRKG